MKSAELIDAWILELTARNYSPTTLRLRRWQVTTLQQQAGGDLRNVTRADAISVLAAQRSAAAKAAMLAGFRSFFEWCRETGHAQLDPVAGIRAPKRPRRVPSPIPDAEFAAALAAADERTTAILLLARLAGLRCCEIAPAHSRDLVQPGRLLIRGKGDHDAIIPVPEPITGLFQSTRGWLFPATGSRPAGPHLLAASVMAIGNRHLAVHAPGWTMHKLRHAYITEAHERTGDVFITQTLARHASPETTRGYTMLRDSRIAEAGQAITGGIAA